MDTQTIKIKKLHPDAKIPFHGTPHSAGYDLYNLEEVIIPRNESLLLKTGLSFEIPMNHYLMIAPRSSLCLKKSLMMTNSVGIIDSDYRGELFIALRNLSNTESITIEKHERIAQAILQPFSLMNFEEVETLSDTIRGTGGFASTGKK